MRARAEALTLLGLPFALAALAGKPWSEQSGTLTGPGDPTAPLVGVLALLAWACCGWLLLVGLVTASGPRLERLARLLAPASVRGLVRIAVGATAVTVLSGTPALATAPVPQPAVTAAEAPPPLDLDWPAAAPAKTAAPALPPQPAEARRSTTAEVVVVQAGDCLWDLAARRLGLEASVPAVAKAWPLWWSANRTVIGDDPDLIYPGVVLRPPTTTRGEP